MSPFANDVPDYHLRVHPAQEKVRWLNMLARNLGDATPAVRTLRIAQSFPFAFAGPINVDFQFPYAGLIKACGKLETLEVELFHIFLGEVDDYVHAKDGEFLQEFWTQFKAAMPGDVVENTTTRPALKPKRYHSHRQLFDWLLVYTRKKS
jgi:hypothetical protein